MAEAPAGTSLLATCHSSLTTVLWGSEKPQTLENRSALQVCRHLSLFFGMAKARSWVEQTFASQKVCGLSRVEAAVNSDSQTPIAFFGIAKSRSSLATVFLRWVLFFGVAKSRRPWKT